MCGNDFRYMCNALKMQMLNTDTRKILADVHLLILHEQKLSCRSGAVVSTELNIYKLNWQMCGDEWQICGDEWQMCGDDPSCVCEFV